jgi:hypothetical protein
LDKPSTLTWENQVPFFDENRVGVRILFVTCLPYICHMDNATNYLREGKIDISGEGLRYWSEKLSCSQKDLSDAVGKIGNGYTILTLYLEMNRLINYNGKKEN